MFEVIYQTRGRIFHYDIKHREMGTLVFRCCLWLYTKSVGKPILPNFLKPYKQTKILQAKWKNTPAERFAANLYRRMIISYLYCEWWTKVLLGLNMENKLCCPPGTVTIPNCFSIKERTKMSNRHYIKLY